MAEQPSLEHQCCISHCPWNCSLLTERLYSQDTALYGRKQTGAVPTITAVGTPFWMTQLIPAVFPSKKKTENSESRDMTSYGSHHEIQESLKLGFGRWERETVLGSGTWWLELLALLTFCRMWTKVLALDAEHKVIGTEAEAWGKTQS